MYVWPRLPPASARALLAEIVAADLVTLRRTSTLSHHEAAPVAVGGKPVDVDRVAGVRDRICALADALGFPRELSKASVTQFDQPTTRVLHEEMEIVPADAASEDVWSFLTLVVLPDVGVWRFSGKADDRLLGRPRNVFRRLWWRAETIGADLIDGPAGLGEDELVNIMERATLAASPRTARLLAGVIVERGGSVAVARSVLIRDVSKRLLRQQAFLSLDALPDDAIAELVDTCFTESVISLGAPPPPPPASSAVVPPQWLPDPSGRHELRWWDGSRWTEHVSKGGVSGVEEFTPSDESGGAPAS